jgi:hypothetical protein
MEGSAYAIAFGRRLGSVEVDERDGGGGMWCERGVKNKVVYARLIYLFLCLLCSCGASFVSPSPQQPNNPPFCVGPKPLCQHHLSTMALYAL